MQDQSADKAQKSIYKTRGRKRAQTAASVSGIADAQPVPVRRLGLSDDGSVIIATPSMDVDLADPASEQLAVEWWESLTARGGEGMVVKPSDFTVRWKSGVVQPALKVRGREYLRLIYGPDYTQPAHLERLRDRGLGAKRSLATREFALGLEGLERFVHEEPLRRVHECVFAVAA